jgi:hypothetical protein
MQTKPDFTLPRSVFGAALPLLLVACAHNPDTLPRIERYRCELGIEFSARFSDSTVALDTSRGYEVLFAKADAQAEPLKPDEYRNARMSAQFKLGAHAREAVLRYPLLPLVVRCVQQE